MIEQPNQGIDAVSEKIASLSVRVSRMTRNQVQEAVWEEIKSLETQAISWSKILDVMSNMAFQQGKPELAALMAMTAQKVWEVESKYN